MVRSRQAAAVLEIFWPTTGKSQLFRDVPIGRHVVITEGVSELGFAFE